jgi:hypothetical protein
MIDLQLPKEVYILTDPDDPENVVRVGIADSFGSRVHPGEEQLEKALLVFGALDAAEEFIEDNPDLLADVVRVPWPVAVSALPGLVRELVKMDAIDSVIVDAHGGAR